MEQEEESPMERGATAEAPTAPHPAATLVLVRPAARDREVLLLRRPLGSAFAPDAWVFPGGRLNPTDLSFDHGRLSEGPTPESWAAALSLANPPQAAAYAVAAVREAWEETGILLARSTDDTDGRDAARREVLAGTRTLTEYLESAKTRIATGRLTYFAHWITPARFPRRFDTRFFVAEVAADARCDLVGDELADSRWVHPEVALRSGGSGEMRLLPPTIDTLRRLAAREI